MNTLTSYWTGPDFTCFPFVTPNERDFYNLLGVYIESIFKPFNREIDYLIEGWRYDFVDKTNKEISDLSYRGNVLEEMYKNY